MDVIDLSSAIKKRRLYAYEKVAVYQTVVFWFGFGSSNVFLLVFEYGQDRKFLDTYTNVIPDLNSWIRNSYFAKLQLVLWTLKISA